MNDKPVTGSECMQAFHEYRTFEKELKKELVRKLRHTFDDAFRKFIEQIEFTTEDKKHGE